MRVPSFLKDPLIQGILVATVLAVLLPARGTFAEVVDVATTVAIALLFFLYGARLSTREAVRGLTHWKLHLLILGCTFLVYPLVGLALRPTTAFISDPLYQGILYAMLVPSTVQSSVALTGIARGNVSGAVVAASLSSMVGVVVTPLLVMLLMGAGEGIHVDATVFLNIGLQLLLPFVLGQIAHNVVPRAGEVAGAKATKLVDRGSIWMVVYAAFSQGVVSGVWSEVRVWEILLLVAVAFLLVYAMLWLTKAVSNALRFSYEDRVAIQMCGTQKSLAAGLPMASVIFGGAALGILIVPLMLYHLVQLIICSATAARYAREA
ncbi:bile acid:sodium symporter family protein [Corynebacterium timonense]|uniref:Solute carrier family 10 (Sodium/bile acid cotransporter), member 7 n=1 Tax=Corynebacterium timonense TaxID=441500 RepID=A0A1H1UHD3_9CORY|nr:bile acid:sodium symporter family protein [Corynebacterium timonense]SDS71770.1 solute carrier family 10 (sodium/bile acid cotransporter), member 7 [Corynebacterium timonense]